MDLLKSVSLLESLVWLLQAFISDEADLTSKSCEGKLELFEALIAHLNWKVVLLEGPVLAPSLWQICWSVCFKMKLIWAAGAASGSLNCWRPLMPTRYCFDAFLNWNSAAEEGAWVAFKRDLEGGTGSPDWTYWRSTGCEKAPCTDLRSDPTLHQNSYRTTQADAYVNHAHQTQAQSVNSQT